jgi:hypothetical protein
MHTRLFDLIDEFDEICVQSNVYCCSIKPWDLMRLDQADFGVF